MRNLLTGLMLGVMVSGAVVGAYASEPRWWSFGSISGYVTPDEAIDQLSRQMKDVQNRLEKIEKSKK